MVEDDHREHRRFREDMQTRMQVCCKMGKDQISRRFDVRTAPQRLHNVT